MSDESKEQLRTRLLGDEEVRSIIAERAYEIYQQRGGEPGHELDDWVQAESEIIALRIEEGWQSQPAFSAEADTQPDLPAMTEEGSGEQVSSSSSTAPLSISPDEAAEGQEGTKTKKARTRTGAESARS